MQRGFKLLKILSIEFFKDFIILKLEELRKNDKNYLITLAKRLLIKKNQYN